MKIKERPLIDYEPMNEIKYSNSDSALNPSNSTKLGVVDHSTVYCFEDQTNHPGLLKNPLRYIGDVKLY